MSVFNNKAKIAYSNEDKIENYKNKINKQKNLI
jgi:hypothetical protein